MELNWILPAIGSPIFFAAVTIGDKLVLSRFRLRLPSFYLFVGGAQLLIALVIMAVSPLPLGDWRPLAAAYGGGFLWGAALMLMFMVLQREEVSRVTPVWQSSPIFAAILGVAFLDEALEWHAWLAIVLVVLGAAAVSVRRGELGKGFGLRPSFFVLILGAFMIGAAQLLLKVSSEDLGVWHNMAVRGTGLFTAMGLPFLRPASLAGLARFFSEPRRGVGLVFTEGVGPFIGNLLLLIAIANGPVSLVSALLGTRPIFVLALTVALGLWANGLLEDRMARSDVAVKAASTMAVVAGIVLIAVG